MKLAKFDELNVLRTVRELYEDLDDDCRAALLALAQAIYGDTEPHGGKEPSKAWLLALLNEPDPVTGYAYANEVGRKRDYLTESLAAAAGRGTSLSKASARDAGLTSASGRDASLRKAMSYWARMSAQYADIVTGEAMLKAFRDAGVEKVRWYTRDDERVCKVCGKRDGRVYAINRIPPRPHWGCRCWWEPVL